MRTDASEHSELTLTLTLTLTLLTYVRTDASEYSELLEAAADPYEGVNPHLADWEEGRGKHKRRKK